MEKLFTIKEIQGVSKENKPNIYKIRYSDFKEYFKGKLFNETSEVIEEMFKNLGKVRNYGDDSLYGKKYFYYTFENYHKLWLMK